MKKDEKMLLAALAISVIVFVMCIFAWMWLVDKAINKDNNKPTHTICKEVE